MLEIEDLKSGEIYKITFKDRPDFDSLFRFTYMYAERKPGLDGKRLLINTLQYENSGGSCWSTDMYSFSFEKPNPEELHHFLECEKAGKFIPQNEAMKSFNSVLEYVECIENNGSYTEGKIYKIENNRIRNDYNYLPEAKYINGLDYYDSVFKPSTKEAFDLQNNPKQEAINEFKVGDWVTANGKDHTKNNPNFPLNKAFKILKFSDWGDKKDYFVHVDKKVSKVTGSSTDIIDIRPAKLEEIPVELLTDDELLEVTKQYFPVGTIVNCAYGNRKDCKVKDYTFISKDVPASTAWGVVTQGNCWLYLKSDGWAKIVSQEEVKTEYVEPLNVYYGKEDKLEDPNEITIPKVVKTVKKIDFNIEKPTFAEIKIPVNNKPRKTIKPIIVEKFELNF